MLDKNTINQALYDKYIAPTKKERSHSIGIEVEMPVVNLDGQAVEESVSLQVADTFRNHFGFQVQGQDADGNCNSMSDPVSLDNLSFDCSYSNLELSLGKETNLLKIRETFLTYYRFLQQEFGKFGYSLTGMGINPHYNINHNKPVPNERYRMLYRYLHSYRDHAEGRELKFHDRPDFGTFTSASQVQLDVDYDRLIEELNVFGLLEPYKALLFANSYLPEYPDYLCARNMLWERSMQGYNPHNVGMFGTPLHSIEELLAYIRTQSVYCTMRDGKYIHFTPIPVGEYFSRPYVAGEYFDGQNYQSIRFSPEASDLDYLRTFKFEDLTFRGTIEYRSSCCQPIRDVMTVAALHVGLSKQVPNLKELMEADEVIYGNGYNADELQHLLSKRELPGFLDRKAVSAQLKRILDIAFDGLRLRGLGEEILLDPLYTRAERLSNPARDMVEGLERGVSLEHFIRDYAEVI